MCLALKHSHLSNYCVPTNILHHHALQYGCTWLSAWGWGRQGDRHQVYSTPHHLIAYYLSPLLSAMHGQLSVTHISGAGHQDAKAMCNNPLFHWHPAQRGITCPWAVLSFTHSRTFVLCASSFCISQRSEEAACNAWRRGHRLFKWMKTSLCECAHKGKLITRLSRGIGVQNRGLSSQATVDQGTYWWHSGEISEIAQAF